MEIGIQTKVFGLLGYPLKHTLSPLMHNVLFQRKNIPAVYLPFEVKPVDLKEAVLGIRKLHFAGVNVTIPHKERIIHCIDSCDQQAIIIKAVNTVKREENGKLTGYNTDGLGFIKSLEKFNFDPKDKRVILLGAGGAAKAVSTYLASAGVRALYIYDQAVIKAINLVECLGSHFTAEFQVATTHEELPFSKAHILINATPQGLDENDPIPVNPEMLSKDIFVYDLIYNPPQTKLIKAAKEKGAVTCNGLWMLIYQGAVAEHLWQGIDVTEASGIMYAALKEKDKATD
ncbi:MAG: shikimate dehydrogenase [Candidatus Omnitrophota bacterium]